MLHAHTQCVGSAPASIFNLWCFCRFNETLATQSRVHIAHRPANCPENSANCPENSANCPAESQANSLPTVQPVIPYNFTTCT